MAPNFDLPSEKLQDFEWLEDNINEIYDQISEQINNFHAIVSTTQTLLTVMPFVATRPDLARWEPILIKAMTHAQSLSDVDSQIQLWSYLGSCLFRRGNQKSAFKAFNEALNCVDRWVNARTNLIARIGMLHGHSIFQMHDIEEFVTETISLARQVNDETLLALLHFKLAVAYTHRANTDRALGHGQTAYAYWLKLGYATEQDRALLVLGEACRVARLYDRSNYYLGWSLSRYTNSYQSAVAYYQEGAIALEQGDYEQARLVLEQARSRFETISDFPYILGSTHHALGITYTRLELYEIAYGCLRAAMAVWLRLDNIYEQANALHAIGFLEQCRANFSTAREFYEDALDRLTILSPSPMTGELSKNIIDDLDKLSS